MQPRSKSLLGAPEPMFVSEEELVSLACASAQGRRRAVRVQSDANLHKVGCSWSASAQGVLFASSSGPTTPPRFELANRTPCALQTGEPTVSHEGGNETNTSSTFALECQSASLACASAQGRRRAVPVQSDANLHKVGCSWSARAGGTRPSCSAGPTTPLRFEHEGLVPPARQTGEPTVSHEGGNETDPSSTFLILEHSPASLACASAQGRRRAVRVQSDANLHKVACSWSARPDGDRRERSAGPTTPPRFERSRRSPSGRQTGEATVSHEGGNDTDGHSAFLSTVTHGA